jgi:hypothetical protein
MRISIVALAAMATLFACNKSADQPAAETVEAKTGETKANESAESGVTPDAKNADATGANAGGDPAAASDTDAAAEPPTTAGEDEAGAAEDTDAADDAAGDEAGEAKADPVEEDPVPGLLEEVANKRTRDKRALEALAEAEKAGAEAEDLARAANKRAMALFSDPDRAKKFFEWAADKDKTYAEPVFNLAKQAVVQGDIPTTKELLTEVRKRKGGKKLLQQLDFDPTWDIVKDDSEVRDLMR